MDPYLTVNDNLIFIIDETPSTVLVLYYTLTITSIVMTLIMTHQLKVKDLLRKNIVGTGKSDKISS